MKKLLLLSSLIFNAILMLSTCGTGTIDSIYYSPSNINSISLDEKNDFKIKASHVQCFTRLYVEQEYHVIDDFKIAYSPIEHIGLYYSRQKYNEKFTETLPIYGESNGGLFGPPIIGYDSIHHKFKTRFNEFGIGYYAHPTKYLFFELYLFKGNGKGNLFVEDQKLEFDFQKLGFRSSMIVQFKKCDFGLSLATGKLQFKNYQHDLSEEHIIRLTDLQKESEQKLIQYATFFKYRAPVANPFVEVGWSESTRESFNQNNFYTSVGLALDIDDIFKFSRNRKKKKLKRQNPI